MLIFITLLFGFIIILYMFSPLISPAKLKLSGLHILITGGSSGIGKYIAIEAVKQGANVTIISRNKNRLSQAKTEIESYSKDNQKVKWASVDISKDYKAVKETIDQAEVDMGMKVDILVNSAGYSSMGVFGELDVSEFKEQMEVNYLGSVYATLAVIGDMKKRRGGRILFVSSQNGQVGIYGCTAYAPTKFALRGLAESLQMELTPYNVRVTIGYPPDTDTPGFAQENITKPEITRIITKTSGLFSPHAVAKILLEDVKRGRFNSTMGLDGYMLNCMCCGMSPITSITEAIQQVCTMALFRIVGLCYLDLFDRKIKSATPPLDIAPPPKSPSNPNES